MQKNPYLSIIAFASIHILIPVFFMTRGYFLQLVTFNPSIQPVRVRSGNIRCSTGSFPEKTVHDYPAISKLADFSFYVFLFHLVVIQLMAPDNLLFHISSLALVYPVSRQCVLGRKIAIVNNPYLNYVFIAAEVLVVSVIAMAIDERLQKIIRERLPRITN